MAALAQKSKSDQDGKQIAISPRSPERNLVSPRSPNSWQSRRPSGMQLDDSEKPSWKKVQPVNSTDNTSKSYSSSSILIPKKFMAVNGTKQNSFDSVYSSSKF